MPTNNQQHRGKFLIVIRHPVVLTNQPQTYQTEAGKVIMSRSFYRFMETIYDGLQLEFL